MRKIFILVLVLISGSIYAQTETTKLTKEQRKIERKEKKAAKKAAKEKSSAAAFEAAKAGLISNSWVLQADKVNDKYGNTVQVDATTNFISFEEESIYIQLAFANARNPGANGLGGITVKGSPRNEDIKTDKNGNITYTFTVTGSAVSADVIIRLGSGNNYASATVRATYSSSSIDFTGMLYNTSDSFHYRSGRDI